MSTSGTCSAGANPPVGFAARLASGLNRTLRDHTGRRRLMAVGLWLLANFPAAIVLLRSSFASVQSLSSGGSTALAFCLAAISLAAASCWCSVEEPHEEIRQYVWQKVWQGLLNTFPLAVLWDTSVPAGAPFAAAVTVSLAVMLLSATWLGRWWEFTPPIPLPATLGISQVAVSSGTTLRSTSSLQRDTELHPVQRAQVESNQVESNQVDLEESELGEDVELESAEHSPDLQKASQWQTRCVDEGHDVIEGVALARIPVGQKQLQLHLAFCPPLPGSPQVEHDFPDSTPVRTKVAASYPYGIRLEIRRSGDANEELTFPVHYTAWASDGHISADSQQPIALSELSRAARSGSLPSVDTRAG